MNDWDNIKDELKKVEAPLTDGAWNQMEQMLDAEKPKARYPWLWMALAAAVVLIGFFIASQTLFTPDSKENLNPKQQQEVVKQPEQGQEDPQTSPKEKVLKKTTVNSSKTEEQKSTETIAKQGSENKKRLKQDDQAESNFRQKALANQTDLTKEVMPEAVKAEADKKISAMVLETLPYKNIELPILAGSSPSPIQFGVGSSTPLTNNAKTPLEAATYRWEVRAFAMSTYNLAQQDYALSGPTTHKDFSNASNDGVQADLGFDAGVELKYRVYKNFKIGGGIEFRQVKNEVNYAYENDQIPLLDSTSGHIINYFTAPQATQYSYTGTNSYTFISVPISMYYEYSLNPKWRLGAEAIYNHSFLISQNSIAVNATSLTLDEQDNTAFKSSLGSAQLRVSLLYQLRPNTFIALEPSFRQYLSDFNQTEATTWRPRDISLSLSIIYRFNTLNTK